jgi:hypothetical protein
MFPLYVGILTYSVDSTLVMGELGTPPTMELARTIQEKLLQNT